MSRKFTGYMVLGQDGRPLTLSEGILWRAGGIQPAAVFPDKKSAQVCADKTLRYARKRKFEWGFEEFTVLGVRNV